MILLEPNIDLKSGQYALKRGLILMPSGFMIWDSVCGGEGSAR